MKQMRQVFLLAVLTTGLAVLAQNANTNPANAADSAHQSKDSPAPRVVNLKTADGTLLKATTLPRRSLARACCFTIRAIARAALGTALRVSFQQPASTRSRSIAAGAVKVAANTTTERRGRMWMQHSTIWFRNPE